MLTLFHAPRSRSTRFIFLLEEMGVPYQVKPVEIRRSDGSGARDPANPHPLGKVPALVHDGVTVFESPAIAYYGGVLEPAFVSKFLNTPVPRGTAGWAPVEEALPYIENMLADGPYLLGETFSAADVLYGTTFAMFRNAPIMPDSPVLAEYADRVVARPAFARAREKDAAAPSNPA